MRKKVLFATPWPIYPQFKRERGREWVRPTLLIVFATTAFEGSENEIQDTDSISVPFPWSWVISSWGAGGKIQQIEINMIKGN